MSETSHAADHAGPKVQVYLIIGAVLSVFTALSFIINYFVREGHLTTQMGFVLILAVAIAKACLVGVYFMHLLFDWKRLYFMIIPAFILGTMLAFVLMPDIVLAWSH